MEVRLGLAPIALSPAPLVIKILSSTNLKKNVFVYSNVFRQYVSSNILIIRLIGFHSVCTYACYIVCLWESPVEIVLLNYDIII